MAKKASNRRRRKSSATRNSYRLVDSISAAEFEAADRRIALKWRREATLPELAKGLRIDPAETVALALRAALQRADRRQRSKAVLLTRILEDLRKRHEENSDPLRAWEAYQTARAFRAWGVEIPDWVLAYLDRAAAGICTIREDVAVVHIIDPAAGTIGVEQPNRKPLVQRFMSALEFTTPGAGTVLSGRLNRRRDVHLADAVKSYIEQRIAQGLPHKETAAIRHIASTLKASVPMVGRAYRALKATGRLPSV
jgi:hypothetical protein